MAQPFQCLCGKPTCRGLISGARDMTDAQLSGIWLNGHIRELLEEQRGRGYDNNLSINTLSTTTTANASTTASSVNGENNNNNNNSEKFAELELDQTARSLRDALTHAEKVVEAARNALTSYVGAVNAKSASNKVPEGAQRRGPTSRELSGEMGGDTEVVA